MKNNSNIINYLENYTRQNSHHRKTKTINTSNMEQQAKPNRTTEYDTKQI